MIGDQKDEFAGSHGFKCTKFILIAIIVSDSVSLVQALGLDLGLGLMFFVRVLQMGKKLYVGNLAYSVTDGDLEKLFSETGAVESAKVISDRDTGRSKGFGFVEMGNDADAENAIKRFNGQEFMGRRLNVNEARPQESREGRGGGRSFGGGGGRDRGNWRG